MHLKINHFIAIGPIFACKRTKWVKGVWDPLKSCFSPEAQVGMRKSPCLELLLAPFWCMTTALWVVLERTTKTSGVRLRRHASHVCALQNLFDLSQGGCIFSMTFACFLAALHINAESGWRGGAQKNQLLYRMEHFFALSSHCLSVAWSLMINTQQVGIHEGVRFGADPKWDFGGGACRGLHSTQRYCSRRLSWPNSQNRNLTTNCVYISEMLLFLYIEYSQLWQLLLAFNGMSISSLLISGHLLQSNSVCTIAQSPIKKKKKQPYFLISTLLSVNSKSIYLLEGFIIL